MDTITFEYLLAHVVSPPGTQAVTKLSQSLGWSVCDFKMDWPLEHLGDYNSIPPQARHRIDLIDGTGVSVQWYIAHEPAVSPPLTVDDLELTVQVILVMVGIAAAVLLLPVIFFGLMLWVVGCTSGDPVLVAKVYDREGKEKLISCYRWY